MVGSIEPGTIPLSGIDSVAQVDVIFTDRYVTASQCAPSRTGALLGFSSQRIGVYDNPGELSADWSPTLTLPARTITLAQSLRQLGNATGMSGKFHLTNWSNQHPLNNKFDGGGGLDNRSTADGRRAGAVIDISRPAMRVSPVATMPAEALHWRTATVVADGREVVMGGRFKSNRLLGFSADALIWNPAIGRWTTGASGSCRARLYHSAALLLPAATDQYGGSGCAVRRRRPAPAPDRR